MSSFHPFLLMQKIVWWLRSNYNCIEWWISENWTQSRNICGRSIFIVFRCWSGQLHSRRFLFLSIIGSLCGRLFNSHCCSIWNDCCFVDIWNESFLWWHSWYDWLLSGHLLACMLEIRCTYIPSIHYRLRSDWPWTVTLRRLYLSRVGKHIGLEHCRFVCDDDSCGCNCEILRNSGNLSTGNVIIAHHIDLSNFYSLFALTAPQKIDNAMAWSSNEHQRNFDRTSSSPFDRIERRRRSVRPPKSTFSTIHHLLCLRYWRNFWFHIERTTYQ